MGKIRTLILLGLTAYTAYLIYNLIRDGEVPQIPDYYFGPSVKSKREDNSIRPFIINITEDVLQDLKSRLKRELEKDRFVAPLEDVSFEYGFNTKYLKKLAEYWLNKYDWRKREKMLNKYPTFKTNIAGIDIHFQHIKNNNQNYKVTKPLLLLHGWAESFTQFQNSITFLTNPENSDVNFELIIPSLPGYGFSEASHRTGLGPTGMAQIFLKLMKRLGHDQFYLHGSDLGSLVATNMAILYPENVRGVHLTTCFSRHPKAMLQFGLSLALPQFFMSEFERKYMTFGDLFKFSMREGAFLHIHATKSDTLGLGMSNSPTALMGYLLEKYSTWTNRNWIAKEDGGLSNFNLDDLLDNIMVYWLTNSITTSFRLESEFFNWREFELGLDRVPVKIPTGCLNTPEDILQMPDNVIYAKFPNAQQLTKAEEGGHFIALEKPELFSKDVLKFFSRKDIF